VHHYIITLGNFQKWLVLFYCSDESLYAKQFLHWNKGTHSLVGGALPIGVTAYVRVAILPAQHVESAAQVLLRHGPCYPVGGHTSVTTSEASARLGFHFSTKHVSEEASSVDLLMLALPHHVAVLTEPITSADVKAALSITCDTSDLHLSTPSAQSTSISSASSSASASVSAQVIPCLSPIYSMKGRMTPVVGQTWILVHPLTPAQWYYPLDPASPISTADLSVIGQALVEEVEVTYLQEPEDPYTVGKALARLAMLALLADNLGEA
jgi:hypothetical protein